jgi:hypothetical protein
MGLLLRTKRHTATGKQIQVLVAACSASSPAYRDDKILRFSPDLLPYGGIGIRLPTHNLDFSSVFYSHDLAPSRTHHARADGSEAITWNENISGFPRSGSGTHPYSFGHDASVMREQRTARITALSVGFGTDSAMTPDWVVPRMAKWRPALPGFHPCVQAAGVACVSNAKPRALLGQK